MVDTDKPYYRDRIALVRWMSSVLNEAGTAMHFYAMNGDLQITAIMDSYPEPYRSQGW